VLRSSRGGSTNILPEQMFDFGRTYVVVVSGAEFNSYGHMLLNTGGPGGTYLQVADIYGYPRFMNEARFQFYLKRTTSSSSRYCPSAFRSRIRRN
jgi:hypothetical protein